MSGRLGSLALAPLLVGLVGCGPYHDDYYGGRSANEIVFGIQQRVDPETGETVVTAGYDYLGLAHKGGSVASAFRDGDGDGTCYFERFDDRLGALQVESGVATWSGGLLPEPGLQVLANAPGRAKHEGEGWKSDDVLTFDVTGFAMPRLLPVAMYAPRVELADVVVAPAPPDGARELSLKATDDVTVSWTPPTTGKPAHVMVTLDTAEDGNPGGGVRCFDRASSGSAVIPAKWVARLFSSVDPEKPIKGTVGVSSHRQVTYWARGGWTAYIVATTQHEERAYTGTR